MQSQMAKSPCQRALIEYKVIGRQEHNSSKRIAFQDCEHAEQHSMGGTAVLRLNDHVSGGQGVQRLAPIAGMLLRDDGAHLLRGCNVPCAL
jgi:hypothetical protein